MLHKSLLAIVLTFSLSAWAKPVEVTGKIVKVVPAKKEIYVEQDGKKHEFYFTETTTYTNSEGSTATYEDLKVGQTVTVKADKKGKRYDPKSVTIQ